MKHQIKIGEGKPTIVDVPDILPDALPFPATIDGKPTTLTWSSSHALLSEVTNGVERNIRLRARTVTTFDGDPDQRITVELTHAAKVTGATTTLTPHVPGQAGRQSAKGARGSVVRSQITGKVLKVLVAVGDDVTLGQALFIIEAMKMENRVFAAAAGKVEQITVKDGDSVATGKELLRFATPAP